MNLHLILSLAVITSGTPSELSVGRGSPAGFQGCEAPITWRVDSVDSRFGLSPEEASDAIRTAAMLWGEALGGRLLFAENSTERRGEMEIRFLFDERAERARARRDRERSLVGESLRIEGARAALDSLRADLEIFREQQAEANRAYLARMSEYNRLVAALNASGGASPGMNVRLSEMANALDQEQKQVVVLTDELNSLATRANERAELLNWEVATYNASLGAFEADFGTTLLAPTEYHESRRELGPFTTSVFRAIEIYHFENRNDLVLLLAREMGRALGLSLSSVPLSVMSGTASREGRPALHHSDIAALRAHCSER